MAYSRRSYSRGSRSGSSTSAYRKGYAAGKRSGRVSKARFARFSKEYARGFSAGVKARSGRRSYSRRRY